jgi:hypothetical protein
MVSTGAYSDRMAATLAAVAEQLAKEARKLPAKAARSGALPGDGSKADNHQLHAAKHTPEQENGPNQQKKQSKRQKHHKRR